MEVKTVKTQIKKAINDIKKICGKVPDVFMKADERGLIVLAKGRAYLKQILAAEVVTVGKAAVPFTVFEALLLTRKDELTLKAHENELIVMSGAKTKFTQSDWSFSRERAKEDTHAIAIDSKEVGILKKIIKEIKFETVFGEFEMKDTPILIENNKNGLTIGLADVAHCVFYKSKSISKDKFRFIVFVSPLKAAMASISEEATLEIGNSLITISSPSLVTELSVIHSGTRPLEKALMDLDAITMKYSIIFVREKLINLINAMKMVATNTDAIFMKFEDGILTASIKTKIGSAKDKMRYKSKVDKLEIYVPLLYLQNLIDCTSNDITLEIDKDIRLFKITSSNEKLTVSGMAPLM